MQPIISVIIPVYKVEAYLHQCVDSVLKQTWRGLEVILVNDGSPDRCGEICDEYAKKDDRVVVIHKENSGVSDARNLGIDKATGGFLVFVDSDDWIEEDMLELLYRTLTEHEADISCCGFFLAYENGVRPNNPVRGVFVYDTEQAIKESLIGKTVTVSPCWKLYKRSIFETIRYPDRFCEDAFVIVEVLSQAGRVVVDTAPKYYYRQRKVSRMHHAFNPKTMELVEAFEHNLAIIEKNYPDIADVGKAKVLRANLDVLRSLISSKDYKKAPAYKKLLAPLRDRYRFIMGHYFFSRSEKIVVTALKINVHLFKLLLSIHGLLQRNTKAAFD